MRGRVAWGTAQQRAPGGAAWSAELVFVRRRSMRAICLLSGLLAFESLIVGSRNASPHPFVTPIAQEYFYCPKCGSLDGGIYGKGPLRHYRTPSGADCFHNWSQISRSDFKSRASSSFIVDWSAETPWWQAD